MQAQESGQGIDIYEDQGERKRQKQEKEEEMYEMEQDEDEDEDEDKCSNDDNDDEEEDGEVDEDTDEEDGDEGEDEDEDEEEDEDEDEDEDDDENENASGFREGREENQVNRLQRENSEGAVRISWNKILDSFQRYYYQLNDQVIPFEIYDQSTIFIITFLQSIYTGEN